MSNLKSRVSIIFFFYSLVRQGSKYLDGKLVGADYELEVSESFAEKYVGILSQAIKTGGETSELAISDETRFCKSFL